MDKGKMAALVTRLHTPDGAVASTDITVEDRELLREMERIVLQMEDIEHFTEHDVNLEDSQLDILNGIRSIRQGTTRPAAVKLLQKQRKDRASQEMIEKLLNPKLVIPPGPPLRPGKYVAVKSQDGTEMHLQRPQESSPVQEREFDVNFRGALTALDDSYATYSFSDYGSFKIATSFFEDQLDRKGTISVDVKGLPK